jgi:hypothetical protein
MKKVDNAEAFAFAVPAITSRGDGSFLVVPGKPLSKLTIQQAARLSGRSYWTIWRLYQAGFIVGERLGPNCIMIYSESLLRHLEQSRNPEFWEDASNRKKYAERGRIK